ncbi:hypothetical protein LY90DRAFT_519786 [Neocallimastix californiae]|uniref:Helicase ATP-binding domain-containing protein n=1 Tax=Neocallimastix californiae TaxID=1754190 RepID=A0A1Y1YSC6_9FUNG|nr:hypothetical protein LY90DRAFT_519786 [Neocallimastix californiae]|eukprot:ORY00876.1 hypothetical protein LY90DRAFT_519786 [Neocallimastix californiae]
MGLGKTIQTISLIWTLLTLIICPASLVMLRSLYEDLSKVSFDIIICDEGHRLKSAQIKTALAIKSLNISKRIILSGTPIQNDMGEFLLWLILLIQEFWVHFNLFEKYLKYPL